MIVLFKYSSTAVFSSVEIAHAFIEILKGFGLQIERAGSYESIRKEFDESLLEDFWAQGHRTSGVFIFRGNGRFAFNGMVAWDKGLRPGSQIFNTVRLELKIKKPADSQLLEELGDLLFGWSHAVYGLVTEKKIYDIVTRPRNILEELPGLYWINYFGSPYYQDPDFVAPKSSAHLASGLKVRLADQIDDPDLSDSEFLRGFKKIIGEQWFGESLGSSAKTPQFDFTQLWRQELH